MAEGVTLSVGVRNSNDKKSPIGLCVGSRTYVCDNLAFSSEIVISKKHTRNGRNRFNEGVANVITRLREYKDIESQTIAGMQRKFLLKDKANSIMFQAMRKKIVPARLVPKLAEEWEQPTDE